MANVKFTDLNPNDRAPTLAGTDILAVTTDPDGTGAGATSKATTITNLMGQAPVQSVNTATGAVVLDADDIDDSSTTNKFVTESDITNLGNLSGTNTGDQDLSSYQLQPTEGAFADGDKAKLDSALQSTDSINALSDVDTSTTTPSDGQALVWDNANSKWEPGTVSGGASAFGDLTDVTITTPSTEDVVKYDGSAWVNGQVSVDVNTPINEALRGTTNPHIGAYPNQPFNALENSAKSVMVVTNSAGELDFLIPDGGGLFLNSPTGGRIAPSFGFSVVEDASEPDIEVASGGENYSVISGDSDSVGLNGLPIRQGFNNPDIGANPSPILISGGSIA
jgi:hypothetical protein